MAHIVAEKDRGKTKDITLTDGAGDAITVGANDKLRAIIGRAGRLGTVFADAVFSVESGADTANGSSFTKGGGVGGSHRLRLDALDLTFAPGEYTLFIDLFDNADAQEYKNVSRQVFSLLDT